MRKRGETMIPDCFELTPSTLAWLEKKYPQIDVEETLERFICSAHAHGWMYANWQMAFQTIVRRGMDNGWRSIVTLKGGIQVDPRWQSILHEGRKFGFREPEQQETPASYKTALELWKREPRKASPLNVVGLLRKVV